MVRETFTIRVEVLDCSDSNTAIANAASYLAYCDTTDTIGNAPNIKEVLVNGNSSGPTIVNMSICLNISGDEHLQEFMQELATLSKVLSVERHKVLH
jgi:(p)ppGpp synthase/HD superfamily hydrolase